MSSVSYLTVRGFKSIAALERFELGSLNVLIGPNGAGKSNLLGVFRMLSAMAHRRLQVFVAQEDGPDALLFQGREETPVIEIEYEVGKHAYYAGFEPAGLHLTISHEGSRSETRSISLGGGYESNVLVPEGAEIGAIASFLRERIAGWRVYHFSNTTTNAKIRQAQPVRDNVRLHQDGSNLGPFLRYLRERYPASHRSIVDSIRLVAPYFGDFYYRSNPGERVELEWCERSDQETLSNRILGPRQLSDGLLRFICLSTLLNQPVELQPDPILIDEPELGLHPAALAILAALLDRASEARQVIVSTQSAALVNDFRPEDVVVAERQDGASSFRRVDPESLSMWLDDYALGDLWMMNVIGGRP